MDKKPFDTRLRKLRRALKRLRATGFLVSKPVNVSYLTGFTGHDSYLLVTASNTVLVSDFRYVTQIEEECPGVDLEIRGSGTTLAELAANVLSRFSSNLPLCIEDTMALSEYGELEKALSRHSLRIESGVVEGLREIKDRHEITQIRESVRVAQRAFQVIRAKLKDGQSERLVAADVEHQIRQFGGEGCSFDPIVAVGDRAALPHAVPSERRIGESDFVLLDWGANLGHYASDLTRVLVTGKISPKLERIYGVVLKAQLAAIRTIRPGKRMHEVDAAARTVIAKAGFGKQFGHGLGHGIGLEIHEAPRLAPHQDRLLKAGMVVTVEPGIYLPGWGGVRIEDDVHVTRDGHEVLSDVPKELDQCLVR